MTDISESNEIERLREENNSLRTEIERLKEWNKRFYGRTHYYFNTLKEWKDAPKFSDQRNKLTKKCMALEEQFDKEFERIDRIMANRKTDIPAEADKPLAVQTELKMEE